jgi:alpha-amylase/alpha-mannosidase (GH57 family)
MHQPFYKDLATGEYQLPWTRMHALKDYYGMVQALEGFPEVHQTFNLVPSLLMQVEEYASGRARDPFFRCAVKPAEELSNEEREFALRYFFQANIPRVIYRYPRYGELFEAWRAAGYNPARARRAFTDGALRDLQVLSQLAWFDEEFLERDEAVRALVAKGRGFDLDDQRVMAAKQLEIVGKVLPVYRDFAARGQIELSITPYYHPILPLLCDSRIASISHPNVPLPSRFRYPQDARHQIETARAYAIEKLGAAPKGMWPSEGSVSDEALALAAAAGFEWMATDNGVLGATLERLAGPFETYQPYLWRQGGLEMRMLFRDHYLSDLIGFVYSRMDANAAAQSFLDHIETNCRPILASGRDALVPIILDGENAWEHYEGGGRPFLKELYRRITAHPGMTALTVSEALLRFQPVEIGKIFPGSWINANFDVWIGADEDNQAWEYLLRARQTYDRVMASAEGARIPDDRKKLAFEELMIAEGSDWCWWYGPEHHSENRAEFDKLFRDHLAQVYHALGLTPPDELSRPILKVQVEAQQEVPRAAISPLIDGQVTSYFEWMGAGLYLTDQRQGSMHGFGQLVTGLHYGCDATNFYWRLDFESQAAAAEWGVEVQLTTEAAGKQSTLRLSLSQSAAEIVRVKWAHARKSSHPERVAFGRILELSATLNALNALAGERLRFQISLWRDGLPIGAIPAQGWLELTPGSDFD